MRRSTHAEVASRRPAVRRSLGCVLAAIVLVPACANASSPTSSHATSQPTASSGRGLVTPEGGRAKPRKPITVKVAPQLFGVHDTSLAALSHRQRRRDPALGCRGDLGRAGAAAGCLRLHPARPDRGEGPCQPHRGHAGAGRHARLGGRQPQRGRWIDPPRVTAYKAFVTKVMRRYKSFDPRSHRSRLPGHRQLPGLERAQHRDLLDRHPAADGRARAHRLAGASAGGQGRQAARALDGDPPALRAEGDPEVLRPEGREQAGLEVRRRDDVQPLPGRRPARRPPRRPGGHDDPGPRRSRHPGQGPRPRPACRSGTPRSTTACPRETVPAHRAGRSPTAGRWPS